METTLTLRNRLGFDDTVLWKQFCAKRLHLIHTLSLNSRKASEQEDQVRSIASDLCAEYGFSTNAQADFEKLIIAGIQSVRRNQKRLQRHAPSQSDQDQQQAPASASGSGAAAQPVPPPAQAPGAAAHAYGYVAQAVPAGAYGLPQHMLSTMSAAPTPAVPGIPHHHPQVGAAHITAAHMVQHPVQSPYLIPQQTAPAQAPPSLLASGIAGKLNALRHLLTPYLSLGATQSAAARSGASQIAAEGVLSAAVAGAATHVGATPTQMQAMHVSLLAGSLRDALSHSVGAANVRLFIDALGALAASPQGPSLLAALQSVLFELAMAAPDVDGMLRVLTAQFPHLHVIGSTPAGSVTPSVHSNIPSPPHTSISPPNSASSISHFPPIGDTASPSTPGARQPSLGFQPPAAPPLQAPPRPSQPPVLQELRHETSSAPNAATAAVAPGSGHVTQPIAPPASVPPPVQQLTHPQAQHATPPSDNNMPQQPLISGDRLVTLKFDNQQLQLTYSPLKSTPPALTEIIENARQTFRIEADRVVRVKDTQRGKIIETNAELIEAFSQPTVTLEILLPPPMLHDSNKHSRNTNFASLAPILQPSAK